MDGKRFAIWFSAKNVHVQSEGFRFRYAEQHIISETTSSVQII